MFGELRSYVIEHERLGDSPWVNEGLAPTESERAVARLRNFNNLKYVGYIETVYVPDEKESTL